MARQAGIVTIKGTIDDITFYEMEGGYYARKKSSLTGRRFQKDKAFEGSRKSCSRFGLGNQLASKVYRTIQKNQRIYPVFCELKRLAIDSLKKGHSAEQVVRHLQESLLRKKRSEKREAQKTKKGAYINFSQHNHYLQGKTG
jgi:hypothetical protein